MIGVVRIGGGGISWWALRMYLLQCSGHDLRTVVDSQDDIRHTCCSESLDLVLDHGLVGELHQWLWESEGLASLLDLHDHVILIPMLFVFCNGELCWLGHHTKGRNRVP